VPAGAVLVAAVLAEGVVARAGLLQQVASGPAQALPDLPAIAVVAELGDVPGIVGLGSLLAGGVVAAGLGPQQGAGRVVTGLGDLVAGQVVVVLGAVAVPIGLAQQPAVAVVEVVRRAQHCASRVGDLAVAEPAAAVGVGGDVAIAIGLGQRV